MKVDLVDLVCFVHLVSFLQPNKPNKPNGPDNGILMLLDHFPEVVDRTTEGIFQLYLRLPFQDRTSPTDIGPSDLGIIGGQRMVGDGAG